MPGLRILNAEEAHEMEPNLAENVAAALYAPSAAVIDPWGLCIAEAETAVRNGVELKLRSEVTGIEDKGDYVLVHTKSGDYETKVIVNCAGGWGGDICARPSGKRSRRAASITCSISRAAIWSATLSSSARTGSARASSFRPPCTEI